MLSHWKQEAHFLKPETLFKNRLKSIEPARREEERGRDRETERDRERGYFASPYLDYKEISG